MSAYKKMTGLSDKLHEIVVQELDFKDSQINRYLDNLAMNMILTTLSQEQRLQFYQLVAIDDLTSAKSLVLKVIPDFHKRLLVKVREVYQEIL